jgi:hypothetical protein
MALRLSHFAELIARPGGSVKFGESFFERPLVSGPGAIVVLAQPGSAENRWILA